MADPHELVSSYEQRTTELLRRAEQTKAEIQNVTGTAASADRAVIVTVTATGALHDLRLGAAAEKVPKSKLAGLILTVARRAQADAARRVTAIMSPLIGDNSETMRFIKNQLPDSGGDR